MFRQNFNGAWKHTYNYVATDADNTALLALLDGEIVTYTAGAETVTTGTATAYPLSPNLKVLSVSGKTIVLGRPQYRSETFRVPHVKSTVNSNELIALIAGQFDVDFETSTVCDSAKEQYNRLES